MRSRPCGKVSSHTYVSIEILKPQRFAAIDYIAEDARRLVYVASLLSSHLILLQLTEGFLKLHHLFNNSKIKFDFVLAFP